MLRECIEAWVTDENGVYVDATFGGGGHSREVLSILGTSARLIAFDRDPAAAENVPDDPRFRLIQANFSLISNHLRFLGIEHIDGLLADLGVSSHQLDNTERGFSIRGDAPLDMRMDRSIKLKASTVVNTYSREQLEQLFRNYAEIREWRALAAAIVAERQQKAIKRTAELIRIGEGVCRDPKRNRFMAKVFQAIRIEVNAELEALKELLQQAAALLKPGGRLVVMSYHSLEDRLVKNFMRSGNFSGQIEKDFFGKPLRSLKPLPGMPISPSEEELKENSRSRSAKLRIAIRE